MQGSSAHEWIQELDRYSAQELSDKLTVLAKPWPPPYIRFRNSFSTTHLPPWTSLEWDFIPSQGPYLHRKTWTNIQALSGFEPMVPASKRPTAMPRPQARYHQNDPNSEWKITSYQTFWHEVTLFVSSDTSVTYQIVLRVTLNNTPTNQWT